MKEQNLSSAVNKTKEFHLYYHVRERTTTNKKEPRNIKCMTSFTKSNDRDYYIPETFVLIFHLVISSVSKSSRNVGIESPAFLIIFLHVVN